eukprot:m.110593 g.110593  ORF g.110593 m.110593 type:complete len:353 (+) comp12752_c1_seq1:66-1124(+)
MYDVILRMTFLFCLLLLIVCGLAQCAVADELLVGEEECDLVIVTSVGGINTSSHRWNEIQYALTMNAVTVMWKCMVILVDGELKEEYQQQGKDMFQCPSKLMKKVLDRGYWNAEVARNAQTSKTKRMNLMYDAILKRTISQISLPVFNIKSAPGPHVVLRDAQATYQDLMILINNQLPSKQPVALMNGDVHLDLVAFTENIKEDPSNPLHSHPFHLPTYLLDDKKRFLALTRHPLPLCYEVSGGGVNPLLPKNLCTEVFRLSYVNSADTFLFASPFSGDLSLLDFVPNLHGAENKLVWVAKNTGDYSIENPCSQLRTYHVHCGQTRKKRGSFRVDERFKGKIPRTHLNLQNH